MINDAHCHFFSAGFFATLGSQLTPPVPGDPAVAVPERLGWQPPGDPASLADRWVGELDTHGVARAAVMASVPGDEVSVAAAVRRYPDRLVGMTMVNPTAPDAGTRVPQALGADGLRCVCLFGSSTQMCARFSPSRSAPWEEGADALVPANQR